MTTKTCTSTNHFIDTNVILRHANNESGEFSADIETILSEATGKSPTRALWVSNIIFGELRPSSFKPGPKFKSIDDLAKYIRSIATVVSPDPLMMLRVARLRDIKWERPGKMTNEKPRCLTLGDATHLVCALWVKEAAKVSDIEFLTFDDSADKSVETDPGTKSLPLLSLEQFTYGIASNPDVAATIALPRVRPILPQAKMIY